MFDRLKKILISGGKIISNEEPVKLDTTNDDKQRRVAQLTPRENELYSLLLEGFTLKECAKQLSIKYSTANTHMTAIYKKLEVNSRAELIINYRGIKDEA